MAIYQFASTSFCRSSIPFSTPRSLFKHSRGNRSRKRCIVWLAAGSLARVQIARDLSNRKRLEESAWTEDSMDIKRMASGPSNDGLIQAGWWLEWRGWGEFFKNSRETIQTRRRFKRVDRECFFFVCVCGLRVYISFQKFERNTRIESLRRLLFFLEFCSSWEKKLDLGLKEKEKGKMQDR